MLFPKSILRNSKKRPEKKEEDYATHTLVVRGSPKPYSLVMVVWDGQLLMYF
jgi:hypothetical protein